MSTPDDIIKREVAEAVRILKDDGVSVGLREIMGRIDRLEQRIPNKQLTPEEKAEAYDKMIAEQNKPKDPDPPKPPPSPQPPDPSPPAPPKKTKHWMFGEMD
jgi:hypothetical protein